MLLLFFSHLCFGFTYTTQNVLSIFLFFSDIWWSPKYLSNFSFIFHFPSNCNLYSKCQWFALVVSKKLQNPTAICSSVIMDILLFQIKMFYFWSIYLLRSLNSIWPMNLCVQQQFPILTTHLFRNTVFFVAMIWSISDSQCLSQFSWFIPFS